MPTKTKTKKTAANKPLTEAAIRLGKANMLKMQKARAEALAVKKAEKERLVSTKLDPMAKEINVRLEKAAKADSQADDHRLAAAIRLGDAKDFCTDEKVNFKDWCTKNVEQAYETVRKLATIGQSEDPAKALEDMRTRNKSDNQKSREKKKAEAAKPPADTPALDRAADAFDDLKPKEKMTFLAHIAAETGAEIVLLGKKIKPELLD